MQFMVLVKYGENIVVPLPPVGIENGVRTGPDCRRPHLYGEHLYEGNHKVHQSNSLMNQCQTEARNVCYNNSEKGG